jgi:hypothetical protein
MNQALNFEDGIQTTVLSLIDNAPTPYNSLGMGILMTIWPSGSPAPVSLQEIILAIDNALDRQTVENAEAQANAFRLWMETSFPALLLDNSKSYATKLAELNTWHLKFTSDIIAPLLALEDNAHPDQTSCLTLSPIAAYTSWHLALLQQMIVLDTAHAADYTQSSSYIIIQGLATQYATKIEAIHTKYYNSTYFKLPYATTGPKYRWGSRSTAYGPLPNYSTRYWTYMVNGVEAPIKTQKDTSIAQMQVLYDEALVHEGYHAIPEVISSYTTLATRPISIDKLGKQKFSCYDARVKLNNTVPPALAEIFYFSNSANSVPAEFKNLYSYYNHPYMFFEAYTSPQNDDMLPIFLFYLDGTSDRIFYFSRTKPVGQWTNLGVAFYAYETEATANLYVDVTGPPTQLYLMTALPGHNFQQTYFFCYSVTPRPKINTFSNPSALGMWIGRP